MIFVCILVLDIQDLCALPTHYARVLRWAVPGFIASFVSLVMITSQRNALVDDFDHRLSPIRCCFFTTKSRPVRAWQHSSYRNLQKLETRSMTYFRGFTLLQSSENVTNLRSPQRTCRSSSIACVSTIKVVEFRDRSLCGCTKFRHASAASALHCPRWISETSRPSSRQWELHASGIAM